MKGDRDGGARTDAAKSRNGQMCWKLCGRLTSVALKMLQGNLAGRRESAALRVALATTPRSCRFHSWTSLPVTKVISSTNDFGKIIFGFYLFSPSLLVLQLDGQRGQIGDGADVDVAG